MELLRSNLSRVQIPEPTHRIYKHECCLSFDTPVNPLTARVDGGFDNNETEYEESYSIVILPDFVSLPFPSVELPEKVRIAVDTVLSAVGAERREQVAAWTAEAKKASEHALTLQQIKSGVVIPPSGWKCAKTKLGHGLLSGKYSIPVTEKDAATAEARQEGIPPRMFKSVVAAGHGEFSSMRQQDALDFFLHLLDKVERGNNTRPDLDPSRSFKFGVEEKILCSSGKVSYNKRDDCILSLNIPLQEATNKDELEAFNNQTAGKGLEENNMSTDEIVRPRVPLEACLATFASPEQIHDYYSTALKGKTTAIKALATRSKQKNGRDASSALQASDISDMGQGRIQPGCLSRHLISTLSKVYPFIQNG
ncbi:hypothetical protein F2Q70_00022807 [Brassica cretica]|uniref:Peptidase C19 ubiquitin carboxyl-terminal hydrolase domain-containing protein n=1 Tax=Brassica cretica TaxID=69181 RepID=A0A8S9GK23_BRACR|nr:hypothetical protein F2Q70_00022807 [Brassica cretica]